MERTFSGITGKFISRIGLGCVTFGREIDKTTSFKIMDHALKSGITFFDTASAYGNGASEYIIGEWLASRYPSSGSILVATKILPPYDRENISRSILNSQKRLGKEVIDLVYFHRWDVSLKNPDPFIVFGDLVSQGKVRMIGASNFNAEQLAEYFVLQKKYNLPLIRFIQNNNNLAVRDVTEELIDLCSENGIFIVTYSPLGAGFLTGKHQTGVRSGTRFDIIPGHKDIYFNEAAFRRLVKLKSVAIRTGYSPVHLTLAWALHQKGVSSILIGARTTAHIDQAMAATAFDVPDIFNELESE
ncbi:MAG TPA: hypothetical protein DDW27_14090 [Bacteroidales bacterium]|nr:hypothetical protein [Bacteroidales bacterium]